MSNEIMLLGPVSARKGYTAATRSENTRLVYFPMKGVGVGVETMKYEKFWEFQNSMRAVAINCEFSLPGLI